MPYDGSWVQPEVYFRYATETNHWHIYHVYKNDDIQQGRREYWYTFNDIDGGDDCAHGADGTFDVRELPDAKDFNLETDEGRQACIRKAIASGYFDEWGNLES